MIEVRPEPGETERRALAVALDRLAPRDARPAAVAYRSAWRRAALLENAGVHGELAAPVPVAASQRPRRLSGRS